MDGNKGRDKKMSEQEILNLIRSDKWMMSILERAEKLNLPNWLIGSGFIRNKVWDHLHGINKEGVEVGDIDLVYFDPNGNDEKADDEMSAKLRAEMGIPWEAVNETYAHLWKNRPPYSSLEEAIAHWPETCTSIGVSLKNNELKLVAPYGIDDLVNLVIRISPKFPDGVEVVKERIQKKKWLEKWPKLKVEI